MGLVRFKKKRPFFPFRPSPANSPHPPLLPFFAQMQKCACVDPGAGNKYINCWSRFQTKIALRFPACRHRPEPAILQLTHGFATRNFKGQIICATCYKLRSTSINLRWENETTGFRSDAELAQYKNRNRWWLEGRCHPCETLSDSFFQEKYNYESESTQATDYDLNTPLFSSLSF